MTLVNLEKYKIAKLFLEKLPSIYQRIEDAEKAFKPFAVFKPVGDILRALKDQRKVLEAHEAKAKQLSDSRRSKA